MRFNMQVVGVVGLMVLLSAFFFLVGIQVGSSSVEAVAVVENEEESFDKEVVNPDQQVGGAETPLAPVEESTLEFRFPIIERDFVRFTSAYGTRVSPILNIEVAHQGIDISATWRAEVVAVADGVVIEHWPPPGTPHPNGGVYRGHPVYGGMVLIEHESGVRTLYAHLYSTRVNSTNNRFVKAGQSIGRMGNTGMSVRDHLHFEVIVNGEDRVNPLLYIPDPRSTM